MEGIYAGDPRGLCPDPVLECLICDNTISEDLADCLLAWNRAETVNQISNADWIHRSCGEGNGDWLVLERPKRNE